MNLLAEASCFGETEFGASAFEQHPTLLIARMDQLSRSSELLAELVKSQWDLEVVDEAHRIAAHYFGGELKKAPHYRTVLAQQDRRTAQILRGGRTASGRPCSDASVSRTRMELLVSAVEATPENCWAIVVVDRRAGVWASQPPRRPVV